MPDISEEEVDEMLAEDCHNIKAALRFNFAPVRTADEAMQPLGFGATEPDFNTLDLGALVDWRLQHQTRQAAVGVRTKVGEQPQDNKEVSLRRQLIHHFHEVLKQEQDHGLCTGSNRDIHWHAPAPGGRDGQVDGVAAPALDNGNSANAASAAASATSKVNLYAFIYLTFLIIYIVKVATRRRNAFVKSAVPCINNVAEARISAVRPLEIGNFGFVYTKDAIMAAQGLITKSYY